MIPGGTFFVADNSGAFKVKLINTFKIKKYKKAYKIGKKVKVVIRELDLRKKQRISRKNVVNACVVKQKIKNFSIFGFKKFHINSVILLDNNFKPIGTRNFGIIDTNFFSSLKALSTNISSLKRF